jgi:hypothetical protein
MNSCSLSIVASIVATYAFAQQPIENIAESELASLLAVYKDIHSHPELSAHEERTSAIIAKELRAAGCEVTEHFGKYDKPNLKGYGVIGLMKNGEGPKVLVRTDMEYSLPDHSIPACDFFIGAVDPAKIADSKKTGTPLPSVHSSKFAPVPEPTIRVGIIGMTSAVLELMKK